MPTGFPEDPKSGPESLDPDPLGTDAQLSVALYDQNQQQGCHAGSEHDTSHDVRAMPDAGRADLPSFFLGLEVVVVVVVVVVVWPGENKSLHGLLWHRPVFGILHF